MNPKGKKKCARYGKMRKLVPGLNKCGRCQLVVIHEQNPATQPQPLVSTVPLRSKLLTLDQIDAMFSSGVNHQVLYSSATAIVESFFDPLTGCEVNRLTCVGDTWPDQPLKAALLAGKEAT